MAMFAVFVVCVGVVVEKCLEICLLLARACVLGILKVGPNGQVQGSADVEREKSRLNRARAGEVANR